MTQLATLTVNITGNNTQLMQSIAQAKAALQGLNSPIIQPTINFTALNQGLTNAAANFGATLRAQMAQASANFQVNPGGSGAGGGRGGGGGGSGNANAGGGFLGSRTIFGANSRDVFRDLAAGYVIDRAMTLLKNFADEADTDLAKVRAGLMTTGEAFEKLFSKVPAVGTSFAAGRSIHNLIEEGMGSGQFLTFKGGRNPEVINEETASIDRVNKFTESSADRLRKIVFQTNNERIKGEERFASMQVEGPRRAALQLKNQHEDRIRQIRQETLESRIAIDDRLKAASKEFVDENVSLRNKSDQIKSDNANPSFAGVGSDVASLFTGDTSGAIAQRIEANQAKILQLKAAADQEKDAKQKESNQRELESAKQFQVQLTEAMVDGSKKRQMFIGMQGSAISRFSTGSSVNEYALAAADREIALQEKLYDIHQKIAALDKDRDAAAIAMLNAEVNTTTELHKLNEDLLRSRAIYQTNVATSNVNARIAIDQQFGNAMGIGSVSAKSEAERKAAFDASQKPLLKEIEDLKAKIESTGNVFGGNSPDVALLRPKESLRDANQQEEDEQKKLREERVRRQSYIERRDLATSIVETQASVMKSLGNGIGGKILGIDTSFGNMIDDETFKRDHAKTSEDKQLSDKRLKALGFQRDIAEQQAMLESGGYTSHAVSSQRALTGIHDTASSLNTIADLLRQLNRTLGSN